VVEHGRTGLLVDFFDLEEMANCIAGVLAEPAAYRPLGEAARQQVIRRFDLRSVCLPEQLALVDQLINADKH
jgi:glycosyltransferase involved in cell wall biosynthesis